MKPGDRIAQLLERVMLIHAPIVPRNVRQRADRGSAGFGSTGIAAAAPTIGSDGKSFGFSISLLHRPKNPGAFPPLYACVARPVNKKEQAANAKTRAALQKEWDKLTSQGCWDLSTVQEWFDVAAKARKEGEKIHVGRILTSVLKRITSFLKTIQIASTKDESSLRDALSVFSENASCPATMAAGKMGDAHGLLPGNLLEVSDGESADTRRLA